MSEQDCATVTDPVSSGLCLAAKNTFDLNSLPGFSTLAPCVRSNVVYDLLSEPACVNSGQGTASVYATCVCSYGFNYHVQLAESAVALECGTGVAPTGAILTVAELYCISAAGGYIPTASSTIGVSPTSIAVATATVTATATADTATVTATATAGISLSSSSPMPTTASVGNSGGVSSGRHPGLFIGVIIGAIAGAIIIYFILRYFYQKFYLDRRILEDINSAAAAPDSDPASTPAARQVRREPIMLVRYA